MFGNRKLTDIAHSCEEDNVKTEKDTAEENKEAIATETLYFTHV
jgi:hypothetical protein